jgi:prepilin-type N-terminal cleavage/methylation domain-containing protein
MGRKHRIQTIDRIARRAGFTLLEGLIASVVLAILALGVAGSLSASYQQSEAVRANSTAVTLARQLSDEIVSKPFVPTDALGSGGVRSAFTGISAYNNYSDASNAMPLLAGGSPLDVTGSDVYTRQASVVANGQPTVNGTADVKSPTTDFAIVTVNVTCPDGEIVSIPEFVANYAINRQ